tara:strand:+ start:1204 stop:1473 length:270 start_codon:yes stop_codon:yes gene_type:complete
MKFKLKSQDPPTTGITIGGSANSENKSINLNAGYEKDKVGVDMSTNLSKQYKSVSAGLNYNTNRFSGNVSVEKVAGQKPSVSARVSYKL